MSRKLIWDTETSGMILWKEPSEHPGQPHIVQLAAMLVDEDTQKVISSVDVIVNPDDWEIPAEVTAIHGITTEYARDVGVPEALALEMFLQMRSAADSDICHNRAFDARIVRIGLHRFPNIGATPEQWAAYPGECTMQMSTDICRIPHQNGRGFKWPKLTEAYPFFMGKPLEDAHSAMADCLGCWEVYKAIKAGKGPAPQAA